jgi:hypothetical protein
MKKLYTMNTTDDENISQYINRMKKTIEDINSMVDTDLGIDDKSFKGILLSSLPIT